MTQDATRRPGQEPQRHAVGITRTCLASGTMQLPFALAGTLPQGELLVHDAEAGEPIVLWSEPPRQLAGLAPFFERHDLHVNDAVVLEIDGDEIRMTASKRPRRTRPVVQPSTWKSVHDDVPESPRRPDAEGAVPGGSGAATGDRIDEGRSSEERPAEVRHDDPSDAWRARSSGASERSPGSERTPRRFELGPDRPDPDVRSGRAGRTSADVDRAAVDLRDARLGDGASDEGSDEGSDETLDAFPNAQSHETVAEDADRTEMPRAPRVTVTPADEATASSGRPLPSSAAMPTRRGPFAGLRRLTRSLFGRGGAAADRRAGLDDPAEAPDWTRAWDADEEEDEPTPGFAPSEGARRTSLGDAGRFADAGRFEDAPEDDARFDDGSFDGGAFDRNRVPGAALDDASFEEEPYEEESFEEAVFEDEPYEEAAFADAPFREDAFREEPPPSAPSRRDRASHEPDRDEPRPQALFRDEPDGEDPQPDAGADTDASSAVAPATEASDVDDAFGPTPLFPEAARPRGPVRRPVDETPSGVPPRAERFLGGDLRTRLLRYLASPEMGAVAKVERIAKRFDLDEATTAAMLADIADDPPDGLRLRSVRDGAWRIERTLGR